MNPTNDASKGDDSTERIPSRRQVLSGVGAGLFAVGVGVGSVNADNHSADETITLDNVAANAWELAGSTDPTVGPIGESNPELILDVGTRYEFINDGGDAHPLAFHNESGDSLLSQDGDGEFEDNDAVNWVDDGTEVRFTLTQELAAAVDAYVCTVHASMAGGITTEAQTQDPGLTFDQQATASSTFRATEPTEPGVVIEGVTATEESAVVVTYAGGGLEAGDQVTIDLDNVGASAWEVNGATGAVNDIEDVVVEDVDNPTLILLAGVEYTFEELPGDAHPLEFFDADDDALLSQNTTGRFEDDPDVDWEDTGDTVTFTVTEGLAAALDGYKCTIHGSMAGDVQTTADNGDDPVVAGRETFAADELTDTDMTIAVDDTGGIPGEHVAHLIPTEELSQDYAPGDTVSDETADAAVDTAATTVFEAELTFEDVAVDEALIEEGESVATVDASLSDGTGDDTPYVVDMHPTTGDGDLIGSEFIGATDVLSGAVEDEAVIGERFPADGDSNEFPITDTDEYIAMVHIVDEDVAPGDPASPGTFPTLRNAAAADGFVAGGVTDAGRISFDEPGDEPGEVPDEWTEAGLSDEQFAAVDQAGDGELSRGDVRNAIQEFITEDAVDGVAFTRAEIRSVVDVFIRT